MSDQAMRRSSPVGRPPLIADATGHSMLRALGCWLAFVSIAPTADAPSADSPVVVPIDLVNNFPVLEITIDDRSLPVMFDLGGSDAVVLSTDALKLLRVERLAETYAWVDAKGNRLESQRFRVPELRIGSVVLRDVKGHEDAEAETYRKTPAGVGYLGAALVRPFKLVIDYGQRSMTLLPRDAPDAAQLGCSGTEVPFDPDWDGDPVTRAVTDLGELVFVWDTGAPMSLMRHSPISSPVTSSASTSAARNCSCAPMPDSRPRTAAARITCRQEPSFPAGPATRCATTAWGA